MTAETKRGASVSIELARMVLRYASDAGLDPGEILKAADAEPSMLRDSLARMSVKQFNAMWEEIALRSKDRDLGLHFGEAAQDYIGRHVLFSVMMNCPTVRSAIEKAARYHGLLADFIRLQLTRRGDQACLSWEPVRAGVEIDRHHSESIAAMLVSILRGLSDDGIRLIEGRFSHPRPANTEEHRRILGCPLAFDRSKNELVIRRQDLSRPVFLADPKLLEMLERYAQKRLEGLHAPETWADRAARSLDKLLVQGEKPSLGALARDLAISARHLQNKLKAEGTGYRRILDRSRKKLALDCLERGDMTMCEIAFLLGFSEQSTFNHAFNRWTGSSPTDYQKR